MKTKLLFTYILFCFVNNLLVTAQYTNIQTDTINTAVKSAINDSIFIKDTTISLHNNNSVSFNDSTKIQTDSLSENKTNKKNVLLTSKIIANAKDSTIYSLDAKKMFLFGSAEILYEDIKLTAGYIEVDMDNNIIYAEGITDSLGKKIEEPIFLQDAQEVQASNITYNLKTKKGYIKGLYTQQEEGYLHSSRTKKEPNNSINIYRGKYTTCDLKDPHFYLWLSKGKVVPDKAIVSSYAYLVLADVPLYPLMVPFGYFPNTKEKKSGFLIPTFGDERNRGFFLKDGGYYFAINDHMDLAIQGDIYSKGSWLIRGQSRYKLRYKFSGSVNASYSKVIINEPSFDKASGRLVQNESTQFGIQWNHSQDPKARPNSNFNASVNFSSMDNNRYNSQSTNDYLTNTTSSSISFRKTFANTPFNMSANLRHSQNTQTKTVDLTLPQVTFNMNRIFPFKRKNPVGKQRWYEKIGLTYSGNFQNRSKGLTDSVMFTDEMWDHFSYGVNNNIPLSVPLKVLKYFNVSPNINFKDRMYFKRDIREYDPDTTTFTNRTEKGFYNIYDYSFGVGTGTTLYGMYMFKSKWLKAVRHVMTPNVGFSYRPDFSEERYGFFIKDTNEARGFYNPYQKYAIYGMPGTGKSGSVNLSLSNNLEMKVINKQDTTGENPTKKIKVLESFNFSTQYNIIADSLNWSPIRLNARTTLFKKLGINFSANANLYALDSSGTRIINKFNYKVNNKFVRITNVRFSTGYTFKSIDFFGKKDDGNNGNNSNSNNNANIGGARGGFGANANTDDSNEFGDMTNNSNHNQQMYDYDYFDIPWSFTFSYVYNYSKRGRKPKISQTLNFNGDFSLTPKWKVNFRSGWDFIAKDFSHTEFNLTRDLHCWVARLSVVPFGERKSYFFTIGVKSAILKDLKFDKRKSWYDNYAY